MLRWLPQTRRSSRRNVTINRGHCSASCHWGPLQCCFVAGRRANTASHIRYAQGRAYLESHGAGKAPSRQPYLPPTSASTYLYAMHAQVDTAEMLHRYCTVFADARPQTQHNEPSSRSGEHATRCRLVFRNTLTRRSRRNPLPLVWPRASAPRKPPLLVPASQPVLGCCLPYSWRAATSARISPREALSCSCLQSCSALSLCLSVVTTVSGCVFA